MPGAADLKIAAFGFAVTAAYWPGMLSPGYATRWAAILIGIALFTSMEPRNTPEPIRWALGFLLAFGLVATVFASPDPMGGYLEIFYVVILCLALVAGAGMDRLDPLMTGVGIGLIPSAVLCVMERYQIWRPFPIYGEAGGLFVNSEIMAEFAVIPLIWALLSRKWWIAAIAVVPVAMCTSRVAGLMILFAFAYSIWPKSWWVRLGIIVAIPASIVAAIAVLGIGNPTSLDHRMTLWLATLFAWNQYGHGFGWFQFAHPFEQFSHSDVLQVVAEVGIAGFALLIIPVMAFRRKRGTNADRATFAAALLACAVSHPLHFPGTGFLIAVLAGLLVSDRDRLLGVLYLGRPQDDGRSHGTDATGHRHFGGLRGGRGPVSVRPVYPAAASMECREDQFDPRGA